MSWLDKFTSFSFFKTNKPCDDAKKTENDMNATNVEAEKVRHDTKMKEIENGSICKPVPPAEPTGQVPAAVGGQKGGKKSKKRRLNKKKNTKRKR